MERAIRSVRRWLTAPALVAVILGPIQGPAAGASGTPAPPVNVITVDELPGTPHGSDTSALLVKGMNDRGQVIGVGQRAFSWTAAGGFVDLGRGDVMAVGNDGRVLGRDFVSGQPDRAYVWEAVGGKVYPGPAPDGGTFVPAAMNDHGVVAGTTTSPGLHGYLWSQADGYFATTTDGAVAVNNSNQVISRTRFWSESTGSVSLGNLACDCAGFTNARAMNASGQVVGTSTTSDAEDHLFSWTLAGGMVDLGLLRGFDLLVPTGVNDDGVVVGYARVFEPHQERAFRWTEGGGLHQLHGGAVESSATAISNSGLVVGFIDGQLSAWTPAGDRLVLDSSQSYQLGLAVDDSGEVAGTVPVDPNRHPLTIWQVGFVDDTTTPATTATIVSTGGLEVHTHDAADPADGIRVTVGSGTGHATFSACGGFLVEVNSDSDAVITCGSVRVDVTAGSATIPLAGGFTTVSVAAGVGAEVSSLGGGEFSVENLGGGTVTVTIDGVPQTIADGQSSSVALPRPDALVRRSTDSTFLGNDIYNSTARRQTRTWSARRTTTVSFPIRLQNDGPDGDQFTVRGTSGNDNFRIRYSSAGQDVTAAVVAGTFQTPEVAADHYASLTAKVTVRSPAPFGRVQTLAVTAKSAAAPAQVDKVKASVTVVH